MNSDRLKVILEQHKLWIETDRKAVVAARKEG